MKAIINGYQTVKRLVGYLERNPCYHPSTRSNCQAVAHITIRPDVGGRPGYDFSAADELLLAGLSEGRIALQNGRAVLSSKRSRTINGGHSTSA